MTERDYASIISANLRRIANAAGKTQSDVCRDLKIGKSTISSWFTGERVPRMDKIDMLCQYFHVNRSDLMEPRSEPRKSEITDSKPANTPHKCLLPGLRVTIRVTKCTNDNKKKTPAVIPRGFLLI